MLNMGANWSAVKLRVENSLNVALMVFFVVFLVKIKKKKFFAAYKISYRF